MFEIEPCALPEELTFSGARHVVLKNVWERAKVLEAEGKPLLSEDYGKMIREEWVALKKRLPDLKREYSACQAATQIARELLAEHDFDLKYDSEKDRQRIDQLKTEIRRTIDEILKEGKSEEARKSEEPSGVAKKEQKPTLDSLKKEMKKEIEGRIEELKGQK